jgi:hypothetical protein
MAKRNIDNLYCIFDLSICKAMHLSKPIATRVILAYDRNENIKKIMILDKSITQAMSSRLSSWLEDNVEIDDILYHLRSEEIDIDELKKAANY